MTEEEALRRLQEEELDVLLAIAEFCEKHDITWFLMSGSALGALRHGGFIPWDDDIDIGMLREDYDRFCELAAGGLPVGYSLHTCENTPGFAGFFAKVYRDGTRFETAETVEAGCEQAIFVDVFPFDCVSADPAERRSQLRRAALWQRMSYLYHSGTITVPNGGALGALEKAACRVAHVVVRALFSKEGIQARYERLIVRDGEAGDGAGDKDGGYVTLSWPFAGPIEREVLVPPSGASFAGHELPVPARAEEYLTTWYGDWRKVPAPEDRHTHLPERLVFSDGCTWSRVARER